MNTSYEMLETPQRPRPRRAEKASRAYERDMRHFLACAAKLLGTEALPVMLGWDLLPKVEDSLRLIRRTGLGNEPPQLLLDDSRKGHWLNVGMESYCWDTERGPVRLVRVELPCFIKFESFWAVAAEDYRAFYRAIRARVRRRIVGQPPVMLSAERDRLWNNTVGFLRRGEQLLQEYDITPKRGVLLLGEPGNGKTMACRWLARECVAAGLQWRTVSVSEFDDARYEHKVPQLFQLPGRGIVMFDDFDNALRDRVKYGESDALGTFLTQLDGVERKEGIVYLFASNLTESDLDRAIRRPGRIDALFHFPAPDETLRRKTIRTRWNADILAAMNIDQIVADTQGCSFAELEEFRKLLVLHYLETNQWDWPAALAYRKAEKSSSSIGFATS